IVDTEGAKTVDNVDEVEACNIIAGQKQRDDSSTGSCLFNSSTILNDNNIIDLLWRQDRKMIH
ncbi:hypothetical protein Dimus_030438, partial [Dionaea muscipula]